MNIPNVPMSKIVDSNGTMSQDWCSFFQNLITQLRLNVSNEGYVFPSLTAAQVTDLNNNGSKARILFNATTNRMMVNNAGTFQNIDVV